MKAMSESIADRKDICIVICNDVQLDSYRLVGGWSVGWLGGSNAGCWLKALKVTTTLHKRKKKHVQEISRRNSTNNNMSNFVPPSQK